MIRDQSCLGASPRTDIFVSDAYLDEGLRPSELDQWLAIPTFNMFNNYGIVLACSGASNVGQLSNQAAIELTREGYGKMFCLAGIGGDVEAILKTTREADTILAIDGCPVDCTKKTLDRAGITGFRHMQVTALGFDKGKTVVDARSIDTVAGHGKRMMCE